MATANPVEGALARSVSAAGLLRPDPHLRHCNWWLEDENEGFNTLKNQGQFALAFFDPIFCAARDEVRSAFRLFLLR